ncbi:RHS repeat-associated core domain-containing protein, partial [Corynebacterium sp. c9Ua_112]
YALVCDLAGAPQELINTTTGVVEGHTTQTLYGKRTWSGRCTSPLLFAGQYEDAESGWAYNRFRYYNPTLGGYNAQDPLGLAPRLASAQGYVDHAAYWVDVLGLKACPNLNGGRYKDLTAKDLEGNKYERHHLISSHALKETRPKGVKASTAHREGICVRLTPEEHKLTNNYGRSVDTDIQRAHEIQMIRAGRHNELFSEQIRDVQSITSDRDEGLLQAWFAYRESPSWTPDRLF